MASRIFPALMASLLCLALLGCGGPEIGTVTGKVTVAGQPLKGGTITFLPDKPGAVPVTFIIGEDGTYTAADVPFGDLKISVIAKEAPAGGAGPATASSAAKAKARMGQLAVARQPVPQEVRDTANAGPVQNTEPAQPVIDTRYNDPFTSELTFLHDATHTEYNCDLR